MTLGYVFNLGLRNLLNNAFDYIDVTRYLVFNCLL